MRLPSSVSSAMPMIDCHGRDGSTCDAHKCCHPTHPRTMLVPTTRLKLRMKRLPRWSRILESRFLNADLMCGAQATNGNLDAAIDRLLSGL